MSLNSLQSEDDIITKLKTISGIDVMNGEYTSDGYVPVIDANKMFKPYVLTKFNGAFPGGDNGIVGPDKDTLRATVTIYVVTPDDRITRDIVGKIRVALLTDFAPTDGSSLNVVTGMSFVDTDLGYNRYAHAITFAYYFNLS